MTPPIGVEHVWAIVVAGGAGRRFGAQKQFLDLDGESVLTRSVAGARSVAGHVIAVLPAAAVEDPSLHGGADLVAPGGEDRSGSVRAGLALVAEDARVILVHDAARPLATPALYRAVVDALVDGVDGAIPALSVTDTIKRVSDGRVLETLDRAELVAVQTPQAFRADRLRAAHARGSSATDDAALLEAEGATVVVVPGEAHNMKLTHPRDVARALVALRDLEEELSNE